MKNIKFLVLSLVVLPNFVLAQKQVIPNVKLASPTEQEVPKITALDIDTSDKLNALRTLDKRQIKSITRLSNRNTSKSIALSRKFRSSNGDIELSKQGFVTFEFGASEYNLVCAVKRTCIIKLQDGEKLIDYVLADSARWTSYLRTVGSNPATTYISFKPNETGLTSSLDIYTDRRFYKLLVSSDEGRYLPLVAFSYGDDSVFQDKWDSAHRSEIDRYKSSFPKQHTAAVSVDSPSGAYIPNIENINRDYDVSGHSSIKPVDVYDDGVKTYILFSDSLRVLPALTLRSRIGKEVVTYKVKNGNLYVIDLLIDSAILTTGVGRKARRVSIVRG